jgi:hypothetical protein
LCRPDEPENLVDCFANVTAQAHDGFASNENVKAELAA